MLRLSRALVGKTSALIPTNCTTGIGPTPPRTRSTNGRSIPSSWIDSGPTRSPAPMGYIAAGRGRRFPLLDHAPFLENAFRLDPPEDAYQVEVIDGEIPAFVR